MQKKFTLLFELFSVVVVHKWGMIKDKAEYC